MTLSQLRALVAVADEGHFTRAASLLHVAQPALSRQIQALETELGVRLLERTPRRVTVTAAGHIIVHRARRALAELNSAHAELRELSGLVAGQLTVGLTHAPGALDIAKLLADYSSRHPAVRLTLREGLSPDLANQVRNDELDLALVLEGDPTRTDGLDWTHLASEPLVLLTAATHPLARRTRVNLAALRDERFVTFREGAAIRSALTAAAHRSGYEPTVAFEVSEATRLRSIVAEGLGVGILPRSDADAPGPLTTSVPLHDAGLQHRLAVITRIGREHSPAAREFLARLAAITSKPRTPSRQ
jgi:DNA-binding transcriptional LysR family regulator